MKKNLTSFFRGKNLVFVIFMIVVLVCLGVFLVLWSNTRGAEREITSVGDKIEAATNLNTPDFARFYGNPSCMDQCLLETRNYTTTQSPDDIKALLENNGLDLSISKSTSGNDVFVINTDFEDIEARIVIENSTVQLSVSHKKFIGI